MTKLFRDLDDSFSAAFDSFVFESKFSQPTIAAGLANGSTLSSAIDQTPISTDASQQDADVGPLLSPTTDTSTPLTPGLTVFWAGPTEGNSGGLNPPDLNIAAGTNHLITTVNARIDIWDKFGNNLSNQTLQSLFGQPSGDFLFDPRVMWDQFHNRFIVVSDESTGGTGSNDYSRLHIAVSQDADPTHGWFTYDYNVRSGNNWLDYPVLGIDRNGLYITGNYFSAADVYQNSAVWAFDLNGLESNGGSGSLVGFNYGVTSLGSPINDLFVPAHMLGNRAGMNGDFFVEYQQNNAGNDTLRIDRVENAWTGTANFTLTTLNVGNISDASPTGAQQRGSAALIDSGDSRIQNAIWQGDRLYAVTEIHAGTGATARDLVHWFVVDTSNLAAPTLLSQGNIDYGGNTSTYYGNLTVDSSGNAIIGYSYSSPTDFVSAVYNVGTGTTFDNGTFLVNGLGANTNDRWGDYSGVAIDPVDSRSFWVFNEFATANNSWASEIGGRVLTSDDFAPDQFTTATIPVATGSSTGNIQFSSDHDWFRMNLSAGHSYVLDQHGSPTGAGTLSDPFMSLQNASGTTLFSDDDSGIGFESQLAIRVNTSGTYYIDAHAFGSAQGTYTVEFEDLGTGATRFRSPTLELNAFGPSAGGWTDQNHTPRMLGQANTDTNDTGLSDIFGFGSDGVYVALGQGGGFANPAFVLPAFGSSAAGGAWTSQDLYPRAVANVDASQHDDIVGFGDGGVYVALSNGNDSWALPNFTLPSYGASAAGGGWSSQDQFPRELADVNGDGRADIIGFGDSGVWVSLATGGGNFALGVQTLHNFGSSLAAGGWTSQHQFPREMADVNGDGLSDIVAFGDSGVFVSLATGGGNFAQPIVALNSFGASAAGGGWSDNDTFTRVLGDVNADGRADIVGFGGDNVFYSLGQANGTFSAAVQDLNAFGPHVGGWTSDNLFPRTLGDLTGDHRAEIVAFGDTGVFVSRDFDFHLV